MERRIINPLDLDPVVIEFEFDDRQTHYVYYESYMFFAGFETGNSTLVQFIPMIKDGLSLLTFLDGARVRIDGEVFIVLDHRWGTLPISVYGREPPFDPITMSVCVHRIHSLSDVDNPFPDTVWSDVPGTAYKIPDDDIQLREVAHGKKIAKLLASNIENINALMEEGSSESDLAVDISNVRDQIAYSLLASLKNATREHIRGI